MVRVLIALSALAMAFAAQAQTTRIEQRCVWYQRDFSEALKRFGGEQLSAEFLSGNDAFIRSGCASVDKICPKSAAEWRFVDILAIRVVNEGMSTTFLPFVCP